MPLNDTFPEGQHQRHAVGEQEIRTEILLRNELLTASNRYFRVLFDCQRSENTPVFISVNASIAALPCSRPMPDAPVPPQGVVTSIML
jgi:predicted N-formylglutamate amidohydrolase